MSASNDDPLFDRLRALPRPEVSPRLAEEVRQQALAALQLDAPRPAAGPRQILAAFAVAAGVLAYFGWAIAFVMRAGL